MSSVDSLLDHALAVSTEGWDFTRLGSRLMVTPPPWDYPALVAAQAGRARTMLDMGTGGGEWLAALPARPAKTLATECWPPNVPVAARRLRALRVVVVQAEGAPDNQDQRADETQGRLPFRDGAIDLVANRHESFLPGEVARILAAGGSCWCGTCARCRGRSRASTSIGTGPGCARPTSACRPPSSCRRSGWSRAADRWF